VERTPVSERWLSELAEFLRIVSISAEPARRDDVRRAGEWVRNFIRRSKGEAELVEQLLREAAPAGVAVELTRLAASPPGSIDADSPAVRLGLDAFERALGVRPLLVRGGGTLPIVPALVAKGIPTILTGFDLPEGNAHAPNERIALEHIALGAAAARELLLALAGLRERDGEL
jgi:acetylornithine deacetylase/succinyl-diaminopimelate desuccinylase-like protein